MIEPLTTAAPRGTRCSRCLCCDAVIIFDGEALCAACDDGTHPPLEERKPETLTSKIEDKTMKVTPELLQAIRDADPSDSCRVVGDRLGVNMSTVQYYRTKFSKKPKNGKTVKEASAPRNIPGGALVHSAQATFLVTDKIVDNWWKGLALSDKAAIFSSNYVFQIEGIVR